MDPLLERIWDRVNQRADKLISSKRQASKNKSKHDKRVKNRQALYAKRKNLGRI